MIYRRVQHTRVVVNHWSPYVEFNREAWQQLSRNTPLPLGAEDVARLRGLGDPIDLAEVDAIYRPLSRLLDLYVTAAQKLHRASNVFLNEHNNKPPFVIAVAGSVAVGKSTTARLLRELMSRWPGSPKVQLVTTDGFLYPNAELQRRGIMHRKGFPESYNRRQLLNFMAMVKAGVAEVEAPVYDHLSYDIVSGEKIIVDRPDILILEGLTVLQPAPRPVRGGSALAVSDFFDFSIYVDAKTEIARQWYIDRFLSLRETAFANPLSFFHRYAQLDDDEAIAQAGEIWDTINEPNLIENILPTRGRATLVLRKGPDHQVQRVRLRKN